MQTDANDITIVNTSTDDLNIIFWLFEETKKLQGKNGYRVWDEIDNAALQKEISSKLQYKIVSGANILCIFSIQHNDPFIWREKDQDDAVYIHRIVVNPNFKGQKLFQRVLDWVKHFAIQNKLKFVRMDTWADNLKIIEYYKSFGFEFIETYHTSNAVELPIQNRNLNVALLQLEVDDN